MFYLFGIIVILLIVVPLVFCFLPSATLGKIQKQAEKSKGIGDHVPGLLIPFGLALLAAWSIPAYSLPVDNNVAQERALQAVPEILKPWVPWVLASDETRECARRDETRFCEWPSALDLAISDNGATFKLTLRNDRPGSVALPGGDSVWPIGVEVTPTIKSAPIVVQDGRPKIYLPSGSFVIIGRFEWNEKPESILVPVDLALVRLAGTDNTDKFPRVTEEGSLWLGGEIRETETEADSVQLELFRRLVDGIPFEIVTRLMIRVAGRAREIDLGNVVTEGATLIDVSTELPYRMGELGQLILQVRPGQYEVILRALYPALPEELTTKSSALDGELVEIWSWKSDEAFRSAELSGAPGIDPNQTSLPNDWRDAPAFVMEPGTKLTLKTLRRGNPESAPNQIAVEREIILDLDGKGATISDRISGTLNQGFRLNAYPSFELGQVKEQEEDLLITLDPVTKQRGVELRRQSLALQAVSRLQEPGAKFAATGFDHDLSNLNVRLRLPPGWQLLHAAGVEHAPGSLVSSWTLLDFFLLMLIAISMWKLLNLSAAVLVAMFLLFSHNEPNAPRLIFVSVLASLALLRVAPEGALKRFVGFYFSASMIAMIIASLLFAVASIQLGLFPQAGQGSFFASEVSGIIEEPVLFPVILLLLWTIWAFFNASFRFGWLGKIGLFFGAIFIGTFLIRSTSSVFFNAEREGFAGSAAPQEDLEIAAMDSRAKESIAESYSGLPAAAPMKSQATRMKKYDAKSVTQTGPGVPNWSWRSVSLYWSGSLSKDHQIRLWLISPLQNFLFALARVTLLLTLVAGLLRSLPWRFSFPRVDLPGGKLGPTIASVILLLFGCFTNSARAEDFPARELLEELQTRLAKVDCLKDCANASELVLRVSGQILTAEVVVSSIGTGVWTIPGPGDEFLVENITNAADASVSPALRRDENGFLQVRLTEGQHRLRITGTLKKQNGVVLQFPDIPRFVRVESAHWVASGIGPAGAVESSIELTRKATLAEGRGGSRKGAEQIEDKQEIVLPDWVYVTRELVVAMPWTMHTTVRRLGRADQAMSVRIPLLFGRNITTDGIKVEDDVAIVNFARGATEVSWTSSIEEQGNLQFIAAPAVTSAVGAGNTRISEAWSVACSPLWVCVSDGITPTTTVQNGKQLFRWQPFPGESLNLRVVRPEGAAGQTVTIDYADLRYTVGTSTIKGQLLTRIRSSQGGFEWITLPQQARVISTTIDGRSETLHPENGRLALPLQPGMRNYQVDFELPWEHSFVTQLPEVGFTSRVTNLSQRYGIPKNRWVLWAGGGLWRPAILFWPQLLLILIVAVAFSRLSFSPLNLGAWILLGVGVAQISVVTLLLFAGWFMLLSFRTHRPPITNWRFNLFQIMLVCCTLAVVAVLYAAIYQGLILAPNMSIVGRNSSEYQLSWYTDIVSRLSDKDGGVLTPAVWFVSLPLWSYRVLMLVWSTWLVVSVIKWLTWAFKSFSSGGMWR